MGTCFSKKKGSSPHSPPPAAGDYVAISSVPAAVAVVDPKSKPSVPGKQEQIEDESKVKKEIFIIKHRKSHDDRDRDCTNPLGLQQNLPQKAVGVSASASITSAATTTTENCNQVSMDDKKAAASTSVGVRVRTSSCNKEDVDAILIQCGRLSRSSSGKAASSSSASCDRGKKYSGSKRSYDFDNCENDYQVTATCEDAKNKIENNNDDFSDEKTHHHRQRHRQSPSSQGRRRTPSRESNQQQRSSSRERRTSRSPGRRLSLEQNNNNYNANSTSAAATANVNSDTNNRPGKMKMVSVPATVSISSLVMDKSNNGESATIKRISVKRNAGEGSRTAASPRSQSPARGGSNTKTAASNDSLQPSLSRSSSRKAEQSPYRRNPLSELDPNSLAYPQAHINNTNNKSVSNVVNQLKPNVEINSNKTVAQGINFRSSTSTSMDSKAVEPAVASGVDCFKPQTVTTSRSSRRSRDLDINPETLSNPPPSYTRLLLQDIHNFHQQSTNTAVVSLPECVTKACSILEAVADLNSTTSSSHVTTAFSADRKSPPMDQINKSSCSYNSSMGANLVQRKDIPFVESEVLVDDDLMEPSFHKYVTVRRGGADMEDQESSGSNSFVSGSQQPHWGFSSSWEPNSADSTDCWTSRSNTREDDRSFDMGEAARRRLSGRKTDGHGHNPQNSGGIGRGKLASTTKGLHTISVVGAAAST